MRTMGAINRDCTHTIAAIFAQATCCWVYTRSNRWSGEECSPDLARHALDHGVPSSCVVPDVYGEPEAEIYERGPGRYIVRVDTDESYELELPGAPVEQPARWP